MSASRLTPFLAAAPLLGLVVAGLLPSARGAEPEHLAFRRTYEEAWLESRVRNVPILVSRHKDG